MIPLPFLPQKGLLQSHFLFVNLLARALDERLRDKAISYVVSPSLTRLQLGFVAARSTELGQAPDQTHNRPHEHYPDRSSELSPDHSSDLSPDHSSDLSTDHSSDLSPDHSSDLSTNLSPERAPGRSPDRSPGRSPGRSPDRSPDLSPDRSPDLSPERAPGQTSVDCANETPATEQGFLKTEPEAVLELNWSADQPLLFWHPNGAPMPDSYEKQLFPSWGQRIKSVRGISFDRRIEIALCNGGSIWIKWFGRNGNVLYHDGERVHSVFRRSHQNDFHFTPDAIEKTDISGHHLPAEYAKEIQSINFGGSQKQVFFSAPEFLFWWKHAGFIVDTTTGLPVLLPAVRSEGPSLPLLEGATQFARQYTSTYAFQQNRVFVLERLHKAIQSTTQKISRLQAELDGLQEAGDYRRQANSLLTYPDLLTPHAALVRLPDCENPDRTLNIRIDPSRTNIENADRLFAKAKRQHLQREHLLQQLNQKKKELQDLRHTIDLLTTVYEQKQWRQACAKVQSLALPPDVLPALRQKSRTESVLTGRKAWNLFDIEGWEVWVGRDARGNAELLRKSHKNDIWMHARGHTGSHVLIRCAERAVPRHVLIQAARLAALNSKAKGEEVCAVSFTRRKYVRAIKGGPAGKVILDREEVIFSHRNDPAPS